MSAITEQVEAHRDRYWCRDPELRIETVSAAERFVDQVGFCSALTDSRRPGPSLYIAVCGRRDAHSPRNVQKDPEMNLAWTLKDEVIRRGKIYYGKLKGSRSFFIAPRLLAQFNTVAGVRRKDEREKLSLPAQKILKLLRKEWELATADLREESGVKDRSQFTRAIDELQRVFKVIPSDVVYDPVFTYIWTIAEARFPDELRAQMSREQALSDIARAYLKGAGVTVRGELARITGISAPEAGLGNWALVDEGFAVRLAAGVYRLRELDVPLARSANQGPGS